MSIATTLIFRRVQEFLLVTIWRWDCSQRSWLTRGVKLLQLLVAIAQGFQRNRLLLRASALTYVTLLSLIPLLAFGLLVVHWIGIQEDLTSILVEWIAAGSPEAIEPLKKMIPQVEFGKIGSIGAGISFLTTLLAVGNAELAFNDIWGVRESRPIVRRFADYLAIVVLAPLALGIAISLGTMIQDLELTHNILEYTLIEWMYLHALRVVPLVVVSVGFAGLYLFLPNTKVRFSSALLGGFIAAVLAVIAKNIYIDFNFGAVRYNAVYGSLALLPLLFVWIYLMWSIVLLGNQISYSHQTLGRYRLEVGHPVLDVADREAIGVAVAVHLAGAFRDGVGAWTAEAMSEALHVSIRAVRDVLAVFVEAGILTTCSTQQRESAYQLGRAAERISVGDILRALRGERDDFSGRAAGRIANDILRDLEQGEAQALGTRTLADLIVELPPVEAPRNWLRKGSCDQS